MNNAALNDRFRKHTIDRIGETVRLSTLAIKMSRTPRVCKIVRTESQKIAPSLLEIYIPSRSLCPLRSTPSAL